ncbi:MAG: CubicO group peptidase (beta-lactamase class C family) [Planctomycetota bacterium]|jgi:CubicO group peptidase (beta-lactamase class C family)
MSLSPAGEYGLTIMVENQSGAFDVFFKRSPKAPHGITKLRVEAKARRKPLPALTWDTLESRMAGFEKDGFSGSVIMLHKGKLVLDKGYGFADKAKGVRNTPKNWGETSWLVMGSGGMLTTTRDMPTYMQAMRAGKILSPKAEGMYWRNQVNAGDNDRGFLMLYTEGPETQVIFCSNSYGRGEHLPEDVSNVLARLGAVQSLSPLQRVSRGPTPGWPATR